MTSATDSQPFQSAWLSASRERVSLVSQSLLELQQSLSQPNLSIKQKLILNKELRELEEIQSGMADDIAICQAYDNPRCHKLRAAWADMEELAKPHGRTHNVVAIMGGNRSGKSFTGSKGFRRLVLDHTPAGATIWCISPNKEKSIDTIQKYIWDDMPRGAIPDAHWDEKNGFGSVNPMIIVDPDGKRIVVKFKTESQFEDDERSFEAGTVAGIWIDESIGHRLWQVIQPRVIVNNGWILMTTIPNQQWMWEDIDNSNAAAGIKVHKLFPCDNPAITDEALARMEASITDPVERAMRMRGEYTMLDALVFPEFKVDKHVVDKWPDEKMTFYAGMDLGLDHPTVWLLVGVTKAGRYYVGVEYVSRKTTVEQDCANLAPVLKQYSLAKSTFIDPSAFRISKGMASCPGIQYCQHGVPVQPAAALSEWNRIKMMKEMFRNDEIFVWKFKRDRNNGPISGDSMEDKNNDAIDALKYCISMQPMFLEDGPRQLRGVSV